MKKAFYRGKDIATGEWLYGALLHEENGIDLLHKEEQAFIITKQHPTWQEIDVKTIGAQVFVKTDLIDGQDFLAFSGDIIERECAYHFYGSDIHGNVKERALIEWHDEYAGYYVGETPLWVWILNGTHQDGFRYKFNGIVGNVHDHPELLEEVEQEASPN